jgi:diguanylate cyclase (GGDEF)-like protein
MLSAKLSQLATPGSIPENIAVIGSYLVIVALFPLEVITGSDISLNILYAFPLTVIALHCGRKNLVFGAVTLSIVLQILTLVMFDNVAIFSQVIASLIVILTNILVTFVARLARSSFLITVRLTTTDSLTGLNNRRSIELATDKEIERQKRYGGIFSFALIDLDGFKYLNDSRGHGSGDDALKILAETLQKQTRHSDTIARLGGDEFVILMPNTSKNDCISLCQQLCGKIASRMADATFAITASIGCVTIDQPPESTSAVINRADKAMYAAKASGKGCVVSI